MIAIGKFILLEAGEFETWMNMQTVTRKIKLIQHHHTYVPAYRHFKGDNHFALCNAMERAHLERGFAEIGQNLTTFPDGRIMVCRNMNTIPAGIKGANSYGICIENVGNFDAGNNQMSQEQAECILTVSKMLLARFQLTADDKTVVYHHWYDLNTGRRIIREGNGITKTCPGTSFFGGNTVDDFNANFLPRII